MASFPQGSFPLHTAMRWNIFWMRFIVSCLCVFTRFIFPYHIYDIFHEYFVETKQVYFLVIKTFMEIQFNSNDYTQLFAESACEQNFLWNYLNWFWLQK